MSTPVSASAFASPSVRRTQLSPIANEEEELVYDSGAEWAARMCGATSPPPPYEADTELVPLTAWDAKREAAMARLGAPAQQPSSAYAPGPYSGELPHSRSAAGGGGPLDARQPVIGDWSAYQEIQPEPLRRAAPEAPVARTAQAGAMLGR